MSMKSSVKAFSKIWCKSDTIHIQWQNEHSSGGDIDASGGRDNASGGGSCSDGSNNGWGIVMVPIVECGGWGIEVTIVVRQQQLHWWWVWWQ